MLILTAGSAGPPVLEPWACPAKKPVAEAMPQATLAEATLDGVYWDDSFCVQQFA
jgi:hypothetical protein